MKLLLTAILASVLLLPNAYAGPDDALEGSSAPVTQEAKVAHEKQAAHGENTFKSEIVGQIVTDLEGELARPELTDEEREKINRVIEVVGGMETLADLGKLADLRDLADLDVEDHAFNGNHKQDPGNVMNGLEDALGSLIPIVAIIFVFGGPVVIVAIVMRSNSRKTRLQHETINKFIESGQEIPADLFASLQKPAKSNLNRGLVLCGLGVGLGLWALFSGSIDNAAFAIIPLCIGAALLLIWKLENKREG